MYGARENSVSGGTEFPYYGKIVSENRLLVMRLNLAWVVNPIYPLGSTCHSEKLIK